MLSPNEFTAGCLSDVERLSFVLPRTKYEASFLVTPSTAIFLEGQHKFTSMAREENSWAGMIIDGVNIEVDETTLFDSEGDRSPFGALVRHGTELSIVTKDEGGFRFGPIRCPIMSNLPPCRERMSVGFTQWQIVLGSDETRRVLKTIDVSVPAEAPARHA